VNAPGWYELLLLAAAAFRVTRLIGEDVVLDPVRSRLLRIHGWTETEPVPPTFRRRLAEFLTCYWCLGFWVSLGFWASWREWPDATVAVSAPLAISALVGLLGRAE